MIRYSDFEDRWDRRQTVRKHHREFQSHLRRIREACDQKVRVLRERGSHHRRRSAHECVQAATARFERVQQTAKAEWIRHEIVRWFAVRRIQRAYRAALTIQHCLKACLSQMKHSDPSASI